MVEYDSFPDAEAFCGWVIRTASIPDLDGVFSSMPKTVGPDSNVVIVGRVGGVPVERHRLDAPSMQFDVYARDQSTAHDIAVAARLAVHSIEGQTFAEGVDGSPASITVTMVDDSLGLAFIPDPTTSKDRYIFGLRLVTHAAQS